jgi:hypothetical protein
VWEVSIRVTSVVDGCWLLAWIGFHHHGCVVLGGWVRTWRASSN